MGGLRAVAGSTLNPTDPIPFASGWGSTASAATALIRPRRLLVLAIYVGIYFGVVFLEGLASYLTDQYPDQLPGTIYLGIGIPAAHALTASIMFAELTGQPMSFTSSARALRAVAPSLGVLVVLGLALLLSVGGSAHPLIVFWCLGPPIIVQAVAVERTRIRESWARTIPRIRGRGGGAIAESFLLVAIVFLARVVAYQTIPSLTRLAGGEQSVPGLLVDSTLRSLISGGALALISALWLVGYLNARSLTDGTDLAELRIATRH